MAYGYVVRVVATKGGTTKEFEVSDKITLQNLRSVIESQIQIDDGKIGLFLSWSPSMTLSDFAKHIENEEKEDDEKKRKKDDGERTLEKIFKRHRQGQSPFD